MPGKKDITKTKRPIWLKHYLDCNNPGTFLNATASAKAAGYKCKNENSFGVTGADNVRYFKSLIEKWLDEEGLSEAKLKEKLFQLLHAKETRIFSYEGKITDRVEVQALGIQRQTLDMAMKVRGMYKENNMQVADPIAQVLKEIAARSTPIVKEIEE